MRLTSRGAGVGLLAVVTLVLGVVFNLPELVGLAAGLTFLVVVSILAVAARPRVDVAPPQALRVERGSTSTLDVVLVDHGARSLSGMQVRRLGGAGPDVVGLPRLKPGIPTAAPLPVPTARRGPIDMGPWTVLRHDAWMLLRRTVTRVPAVEVVVVPRVHPLTLGSLPTSSGDQRTSRNQGDTDISTLREYVVGDELRRVHWRSSAKAGSLMVTQRVDARRPGVHVVLDVALGAYANGDEFEEAVDAAASVAISAAQTGVPVELVTTAGESARAGAGRHAGVLDLLARVQLSGTTVPARQRDEGSVIYVTGSLGGWGVGWGPGTVVRLGESGGTSSSAGAAVVRVATARDLTSVAAPGARR